MNKQVCFVDEISEARAVEYCCRQMLTSTFLTGSNKIVMQNEAVSNTSPHRRSTQSEAIESGDSFTTVKELLDDQSRRIDVSITL